MLKRAYQMGNRPMYSFCLQSEERGTPSRRSKSEGPHRIPNGQVYPVGSGGDVIDAAGNNCNGGRPAQVQIPSSKMLTNTHAMF